MMKSPRRMRMALATLLVMASAVSAANAAGPPLSFTEGGIATGAIANETLPVIDGRYVVYQRFSSGDITPNSDVRVYDLVHKSGFAVVNNTATQSNPDLSYDLVAYEDYRNGNGEIYVYHIDTAVEVRITTKAGNQVRPRVSNRTVVWYDESTASLWYRDLLETTNHEIPGSGSATYWDIDGDTVVLTIGSKLYKWPVGTDMDPTEFISISPWSFEALRTHAGRAAWTISDPGGRGVSSATLADSTPTPIDMDVASNGRNPDLFGDEAVWQQDRAGNENIAFGFLGEAGFAGVGVSGVDETRPSMFGRRVVFQRPGMLVGSDVMIATSTPEAARTSGDTRYATAVQASQAYFESSRAVVICTGENFPDALAASPFAALLNAPLLLVHGNAVPAEVLAEISRLGATGAYIIGGPDVVSDGVKSALETATGSTTVRIYGDDRYETSERVAAYLYDGTTMSQGLPWHGWAFIARGDTFPDALAVGPIAASVHAPILLTRTNALPASVGDALQHTNITNAVIVGGSDVVSNAVKTQIQTITNANGGSPVQRWEGVDRYETAVRIVAKGLEYNWIDFDTLGIATGTNFPDALGGGAALATYGSPLLLVKPNEVPDPVGLFLNHSEWEIGRIDVFGGADVVSDATKNEIAAHLK